MGKYDIDLTGKVFDKLTVIKLAEFRKDARAKYIWLCKCECGKEVLISSKTLLNNKKNHNCGKGDHNYEDLTGQKFGKLTVLKYLRKGQRRVSWICKCDCGNITKATADNLKCGKTKSCGCYQKEKNSILHKTHGKTKTRIYKIWLDMKARCYNRNEEAYKDYGGRGIKICDKWKNDFMSFYSWSMENGYNNSLTIDRINNNLGYEENNCRWVDLITQANNKRSNYIIEYKNEKHTMAEWA